MRWRAESIHKAVGRELAQVGEPCRRGLFSTVVVTCRLCLKGYTIYRVQPLAELGVQVLGSSSD
jgi:hypothetical protein